MAETLATSGRLSVAIMASRVLGLLRESVFAALFGAGPIADAYQVAFRIPNLLRDLLAEGALSSAFVPTFTATLHDKGREAAHALANLALSGMLVLTGGLTALGILYAEGLVVAIADSFGGDAAKVALAADLTRIMMPILALVSLGAVWMGMLNAQRRFVAPALAPALFNVVSIVAGVGLFVWHQAPTEGVLVWSWGTLAAGAAQALLQLGVLWRLGYRPSLRLRGFFADPGIRRILALMAPAVVGLAAVQINVFVNTRFAGNLADGAVAQLNYAFRLFFLPLGVFGVALATVTTTAVSEAAAERNNEALRERTAQSLGAGVMLTLASAVGLFLLAEPIVELVYRHGRTTSSDAQAIALVLQAYVVGLAPYSLVKILAPSFYSVDRARIPLLASALGVAVNVAFNAATYERFGAPGLAFGTTLGAATNFAVLYIAFGRVIAPLSPFVRWRAAGALLVANAAMGGVVVGLWMAWEAFGRARLASLGVGTIADAMVLGLVIGVGFVVYAQSLAIMGHEGGKALLELPRKALRRFKPRRPA